MDRLRGHAPQLDGRLGRLAGRVAGPSPRGDLIAGVVVGVVVVPQSLAFGELAGLDPIAGLYAALVALFVYAAVGSSSLISLGPTATSAILAFSAGQVFAQDERAAAIVATAIMAGGLALAAGIARLGFVANLLSRPVLVGYTAGAAVTIVTTQARHLLGVEVEGQRVGPMLADLARGLPDASVATVAVGAASLAGLLLLVRWAPRVPAALFVVVAAIVAARLFDLADRGVAVVGRLPSGLPGLGLPDLAAGDLQRLVLPAAAIGLVGFAETVGQGRVLEAAYAAPMAGGDRRRHDGRAAAGARSAEGIDANRELLALGSANVASGLFGGFVVSSSFSRNSLNVRNGGRTKRSWLLGGGVVLLSLLFLSDVLRDLPLATLAAIVIVAVIPLIPVHTFRRLASLQRDDFVFAMVAFAGVVAVGILPGLAIAVALSVGGLLYRVTATDTAVLGYVPEQDTWRRLDRHATAETVPGVLVIRFSGPLYFANASRLRRQVTQLVAESSSEAAVLALRRVVIDARSISHLDTTAIDMLAELHAALAREGIDLVIAGLRAPALDTLRRSELVRTVGEERLLYPTVRAAVRGR
jgi:sulfate permease, SulP family